METLGLHQDIVCTIMYQLDIQELRQLCLVNTNYSKLLSTDSYFWATYFTIYKYPQLPILLQNSINGKILVNPTEKENNKLASVFTKTIRSSELYDSFTIYISKNIIIDNYYIIHRCKDNIHLPKEKFMKKLYSLLRTLTITAIV